MGSCSSPPSITHTRRLTTSNFPHPLLPSRASSACPHWVDCCSHGITGETCTNHERESRNFHFDELARVLPKWRNARFFANPPFSRAPPQAPEGWRTPRRFARFASLSGNASASWTAVALHRFQIGNVKAGITILMSLLAFCRSGGAQGFSPISRFPAPRPKRQRAGALQDASRGSIVISQRASVLDCGGPPPLFTANETHAISNALCLVHTSQTAILPLAGHFDQKTRIFAIFSNFLPKPCRSVARLSHFNTRPQRSDTKVSYSGIKP